MLPQGALGAPLPVRSADPPGPHSEVQPAPLGRRGRDRAVPDEDGHIYIYIYTDYNNSNNNDTTNTNNINNDDNNDDNHTTNHNNDNNNDSNTDNIYYYHYYY